MMSSMNEVIGIILVATFATLLLFGVPTAIEVFLHRRAKRKTQQEAKDAARVSLERYGNHFVVPRKDKK